MKFILFSLLMGFVCAHFATKRGRSPIAWFIIGSLFCLFGLLVLLLLPPLVKETSKQPGVNTNGFRGETSRIENKNEEEIPAPFSNIDWFYLDDKHTQFGPYSFNEMRSFLKDGKVKTTSYVWNVGMESWKILSELPQILQLLQK